MRQFTIAAMAAIAVSAQNNVKEEALCKNMSSNDGKEQWDISALAKQPVFDANGVTPWQNYSTMYSVKIGPNPVNFNYCKEWCPVKGKCGLVHHNGTWKATNVMDAGSVAAMVDTDDNVIGVKFTQSSDTECKAKDGAKAAVNFSINNEIKCETDTGVANYGIPQPSLAGCEYLIETIHVAGCTACKYNGAGDCITYSRGAYSTAEVKKTGVKDIEDASKCPGQCAANSVCVSEDDMEAKCAFTDKELESRGVIPSNGEFDENPSDSDSDSDSDSGSGSDSDSDSDSDFDIVKERDDVAFEFVSRGMKEFGGEDGRVDLNEFESVLKSIFSKLDGGYGYLEKNYENLDIKGAHNKISRGGEVFDSKDLLSHVEDVAGWY